MTQIQQVSFKLESDYLGHPYFVTGNALFNAIARQADEPTRRSLSVSHGVFVPAEYGEYPAAHSQSGYAGVLGDELPPVETYDDLFLYRDPAQRWLLDSRPRDAHNAHPVQTHGGRPAIAPTCHFGRPPAVRNHKRSVEWYCHCYLHGDRRGRAVVPVADDVLDGLRVGGGRNYGFGELSLGATRTVDLDALDYGRVAEAEAHVIELVTPYVTASSDPGADDQSVPWWWAPMPTRASGDKHSSDTAGDGGERGGDTTGGHPPDADAGAGHLRRRQTRLIQGGDCDELETIDHGQRVRYVGDDPVATAKNGVRRVGTHARFGYGELWVRPLDAGAVEGESPGISPATEGDA